jgi:hypothetical protein
VQHKSITKQNDTNRASWGKRTISRNVGDANKMATQNHAVTNHSCVLNVVAVIIVKNAKKVKKHQQNVYCVEAIILPTADVANITIT